MKPTEGQIKELWEWCGISLKHEWTSKVHGYEITDCICERCGMVDWPPDNEKKPCLLPITLDNLFRWAVLKLTQQGYHVETDTYAGDMKGVQGKCSWVEVTKDRVLVSTYALAELEDALFWAIYGVIDGNNTPAEH